MKRLAAIAESRVTGHEQGPLIRVIIADDHPVVRRGLCRILELAGDICVLAEAATADTLQETPLDACDVVVLDLGIPGAQGFSVLRDLRFRHPALPILVLSIGPEEQFAVAALREGASGYLTKRSAPEQLVHAIRHLASGKVFTTDTVSELLASEVRGTSGHGSRSGRRPLSAREITVLRLIVAGSSLTAIAAHLNVSVKTISTYRQRLLIKLELQSNAALVRFAIENGLIEG